MKKICPNKRNRPKLTYLVANPGCLVGPAIWFQRTESANLHRKLFKKAWPTRPRFQWYALLSANLLTWHLCFFWVQFFKCIKSKGFKTLEGKGIGQNRQLCDLIHLGLWYGVKPSDYYVFSLYDVDRSNWLNYVFSQQQLTWHRVFSCPPESTSDALVNDKHAMEKMLRDSGIETTTTIGVLGHSISADKSLLFQRKDLFIKPNSANAMRGCLQLRFDVEDSLYRLAGFDLSRKKIDLQGEEQIFECLEEITAQEVMLVQETLHNSEEMSVFSGRDDLVTIKAITGVREDVYIAYLLLEVPDKKECEWTLYPINAQTGQIQPESSMGQVGRTFSKSVKANVYIPEFDKIKPLLQRAHRLTPGIKTLCWDICITNKGVCIIEANTGWGLVSPQQISGIPLLGSALLACYQ